MDDLISRQMTITTLVMAKETGSLMCKELKGVIEVLNRMPSAQQWIPCSERLPEEDGLYLVTTSKGQVQVHVFNHNGNSEEYWMRCNKAWMSLPKPYKGETDG